MKEEIIEILRKVHCGQCEAWANSDNCQGVEGDDKKWNGEPLKKLKALIIRVTDGLCYDCKNKIREELK